MSREDVRDLIDLDPSRFDEREYAALSWVRATLTDRDGAPAEVRERFEAAFGERDRGYVVAAMKSMYFFNLAGNTLDGWMRRILGRGDGHAESCEFNPGRPVVS